MPNVITTGTFETREELERAILTDWGKGPEWKGAVKFYKNTAEKYQVATITVRRIIEKASEK